MQRTTMKLMVLVLAGLWLGCEVALTNEEAAEALDEAGMASQAQSLTSSTIEISTEFTIGSAVEAAAAEIQTFIESQLPCAEITLSGATLSIEYGANPGTCTYRGQRYRGTHSVTVMSNEMNDVVVMHQWTDMQNDVIAVTGSAMVTWSFDDQTRQVSHELTGRG